MRLLEETNIDELNTECDVVISTILDAVEAYQESVNLGIFPENYVSGNLFISVRDLRVLHINDVSEDELFCGYEPCELLNG